MVIPWIGFPLGDLLKRFNPTVDVRNSSSSRPSSTTRRCRDSVTTFCHWPYVEALRIDEAMHPLALHGGRPLRRASCRT